jgi:glucosamine--fructose-6-phosphate aminotransferase (isomerizing)
MCGVFGYTGKKESSKIVLKGLKRLEYRGYDSWGIATLKNKKIYQYKQIGEIGTEKDISKLPSSNVSIGHTRWATHGGVTTNNAHPHFSTDQSFALAQNGIVENFDNLKEKLLKKGYKFKSQTDTEVIVRLIEEKMKKRVILFEAVREAFLELKGRNTVMLLDSKEEQHIVAIRNGSPLVLGVGEEEIFLASDPLSFSEYTNKVVFLDDYDMVEINGVDFKVYDAKTGVEKKSSIKELQDLTEDISKEGYEHYMLKEIVEQKDTIMKAVNFKEEEFTKLITSIKKAKRIYTVGAGTAGFAAGQIAYYLRTISGIDALDIRAYEFDGYLPIIKKEDLILAVSQSGETADTLEVLEKAKKIGCKIASVTNMPGSTIQRMSNFSFLCGAGPEICVASTKVFTSQIVWGYLLAKTIIGEYEDAKKQVSDLSKKLIQWFNEDLFKKIQKLSQKLISKEHFFILGKGQNAFISFEGALKVKEISYKHFEGFMAGELKHGVIALVEKDTPVFCIITKNNHRDDMISAAQQVSARGAFTIGVGDTKEELFDYFIEVPYSKELSAVANVIPFQLISYYTALAMGNNVDKPRNLAKSVTVK